MGNFGNLLLSLRKTFDMRTDLIKIGNSCGIRIAASLLKQLGWKLKDPIQISVDNGTLVMKNMAKEPDPFAAISKGGWYDDPRDSHEIADELYNSRVNTREVEPL
jgi:antitoxin component of MazEF toxin-antitoxin module